jgi:hypothetical protein
MSIPCKFERSILSYDEHEIILRSHHPEIYDAGLDDLLAWGRPPLARANGPLFLLS